MISDIGLEKANGIGRIQGKILYKIKIKNDSEVKWYFSDNENLINKALGVIDRGLKFMNINNELLINVDELVSIEKVGK